MYNMHLGTLMNGRNEMKTSLAKTAPSAAYHLVLAAATLPWTLL
jgi:hypothetical protein